jgi:hypothetical protein
MKTLLRLASAVAATSLAGCAVVDKYSGRAVDYNIEAEQAQGQGLLLNIVRAYLRRPMQFTTVSSITGTATATGSLQYTAPVNIPFRPSTLGTSIAQFPGLNTWTSGGSLSGGPTFTVPVLDTQEFYNGILKPIPAQLWNLYTQQGYAQDLLVNLFVEKIVVRRYDCDQSDHDRGCEIVLQNYVGDDIEIELFQLFSDYLLQLGLTTEQVKEESLLRPDKEGCDLPPRKMRPPSMSEAAWQQKYNECRDTRIRTAFNVNLKLSGSLGGLSPGAGASGGGTGGTGSPGGESAPGKFSLCFATPRRQEADCVYPLSKCGLKPPKATTSPDPSTVKTSADVCRSLGTKRESEEKRNERTYSEIPIDARAAAESTSPQSSNQTASKNYIEQLNEELLPQNAPSNGGMTTPNLSAAVFLQTRIANKMKEMLVRLARLAPEIGYPGCPAEESSETKKGEIGKSSAAKRAKKQKVELPNDFLGLYCAINHFMDNWIKVDFYLRSTEGVIYYLGEIARRQLNPEFPNEQPYIYFNYPRHHLEYEVGRCINPKPQEPGTRSVCRPIFVLQRGAGSALQGNFLSTFYDGEVYSVPSGGDSYSTQVLDILKQALALSSSSKSLPQANVVSVVGGQ